MKKSIPTYFWFAMSFIYGKVFHEEMSKEVVNFLKNLSYVGFGTFAASIFSFTFNVLCGRFLGPTEYGKFSFIQSIAMFLYIPMFMGYNNAMVKYNAEIDDFDRQKTIISTTYILVLISTTLSLFLYLLVPQKILEYFSLSTEIFQLSIVFAVLFVIYTIIISTLTGLHEIKKYAKLTPLCNILMLFGLIVIIFTNKLSYKSAIFSMYFAYLLTICIILIFIRKYIRIKFDRFWAYKLTKYGVYTLFGGVSYVMYTNIDQILINMYMNTESLGIYKAYSFASITFTSLFFGIFNSVFFPTASKCEDKTIIFNRINKFTPYLIGFGIPFVIFAEFVILNMYGGEYKINMPLIILFAIVSILVVYFGLYDWTFCSEGLNGVKLVNQASILIAIINITLDIYLIPQLGLSGAMISTAVAFIIGIYYLLKRGKIGSGAKNLAILQN